MRNKHEHTPLHDYYVRAINGALEAGRDHDARELAGAYSRELSEATHRLTQREASGRTR